MVRPPRFRYPRYDPAEKLWLVVVLRPLLDGRFHRSKHWYKTRSEGWSFIEVSCADLQGEVFP